MFEELLEERNGKKTALFLTLAPVPLTGIIKKSPHEGIWMIDLEEGRHPQTGEYIPAQHLFFKISDVVGVSIEKEQNIIS